MNSKQSSHLKKHSGKDTNQQEGTMANILRAAEELFIDCGFDGVSINDVAQRSGVAKALVFYYFDNKRKLFDTVLDRYYQAQAEALMGAINTGGFARERIHSGINAYLDFVEAHPGYPKLIQREICSSGGNSEKIIQYMSPMHRWGMAVFGDKFPAEGHLSAHHFFVSIFGMAINYYTYSPILEKLWGSDPLGAGELAVRRAHIHEVIDVLIDNFMSDSKKSVRSR